MGAERVASWQELEKLRQELMLMLERAHGDLLLARRALALADRRIKEIEAASEPVAQRSGADARARELPDAGESELFLAKP